MKKTITLLSLCLISGLQLIIGFDNSYNTIKAAEPSAINDTISVIIEDSVTLIDYYNNDSQTKGLYSLGFVGIITQATHGKVVNVIPPNVQYTPDSNFYKVNKGAFIDSFQYVVEFTDGSSTPIKDTAWVFIDSIAGVNDRPIATLDTANTTQGEGPLYLTPMVNDKDPDMAGLQFNIIEQPKHGSASLITPLAGQALFFPNNGVIFNTNLELDYDLRTDDYLKDTALIYTPNSNYYGYDSLTYVISEYRPTKLPPIPQMTKDYTYVKTTDADTAKIIFFIEAKDYVPVAINDTVILEEQNVRTTPDYFWRPEYNDLDADTLPTDNDAFFDVFSLKQILKDTNNIENSPSGIQNIVFYHDIPVYDDISGKIIMKRDSNYATYIPPSSSRSGRLRYTYAPYFTGVDSLFYYVTEKKLDEDEYKYPNKFRKDTSNFGIFYFVVTPSNQIPYANPDTIVFDWNQIDTLSTGHLAQHYDILANDVDIDTLSEKDIKNFERFVDEDLSYLSALDSLYLVKTSSNQLRTAVNPKNGTALCLGDSFFYQYEPPYSKDYLIDSFKYFVLDPSGKANAKNEAWVYIANKAANAVDINYRVGEPFVENKTDSTIASNIAIVGSNNDRLHLLFNNDTLITPSKSTYAKILKAEEGNVNYQFHKGFTTSDRFQYILSDYLTFDTAWVNITNSACIANTDTLIIPENPFSAVYVDQAWEEPVDIKENDVDLENVKRIIPPTTDTIETAQILAWLDNEEMVISLKKSFFYKDSIKYKLTDIPPFFAAEGLFTRDSAWLYIIDEDGIVDSDGDGIPNLMENGEPGYQVGEDTLDTDGDTTPNYLDIDADNDGLKDNGDCDGDGILNFLDKTPGCNEIAVSNVFTPNNDGVNDLFVIPEIQMSIDSIIPTSIHIYDRHGMLVYENDAYGQDNDWWDGSMGDVKSLKFGDELPSGVYVYYIKYNGIKQQGYVHIQK